MTIPSAQCHPYSCADSGIFVRVGGPGQSDKKALTTFFFSPQHILQLTNDLFQRKLKKTIIFQGFRGGPTFSRGSNFFQGGGGRRVQLLIPIETHITCDFPGGGSGPLSPLWIRTCLLFLNIYLYITK